MLEGQAHRKTVTNKIIIYSLIIWLLNKIKCNNSSSELQYIVESIPFLSDAYNFQRSRTLQLLEHHGRFKEPSLFEAVGLDALDVVRGGGVEGLQEEVQLVAELIRYGDRRSILGLLGCRNIVKLLYTNNLPS